MLELLWIISQFIIVIYSINIFNFFKFTKIIKSTSLHYITSRHRNSKKKKKYILFVEKSQCNFVFDPRIKIPYQHSRYVYLYMYIKNIYTHVYVYSSIDFIHRIFNRILVIIAGVFIIGILITSVSHLI